MPVIKIDDKAFALLVEEARRLEVSTKDLVSSIVLAYFGEFEEEGSEEEEEEEEGESED